jgi:ubiquinone/menaquinone biosynthesis C-methylase UbiE
VEILEAGTRSWSGFTAWAPFYDDSALQELLFEPAQAAVLRKLEEFTPSRMLDLGCGTGRLVEVASRRCPFVVGVDPCAAMLEVARRRRLSNGAFLVRARAEQLPFTGDVFDVVTATLSLRHWTDIAGGIGELARVLAPTGLLVIAETQMCEHLGTARHRRLFGRREGRLTYLLKEAGLVVTDDQLVDVHAPAFDVHLLIARRRR